MPYNLPPIKDFEGYRSFANTPFPSSSAPSSEGEALAESELRLTRQQVQEMGHFGGANGKFAAHYFIRCVRHGLTVEQVQANINQHPGLLDLAIHREKEGFGEFENNAIQHGLPKAEIEKAAHDWSIAGEQTVAYIKSCKRVKEAAGEVFEPADATAAFHEVRGLQINQIKLMAFGISREDIVSLEPEKSFAIAEYFKKLSRRGEFLPEKAREEWGQVRSLLPTQIQAMTLDISRQTVTAPGHNWERSGPSTQNYLSGGHEYGFPPKAMSKERMLENIRGKTEAEIQKICRTHRSGRSLGLTPLELYIGPFGPAELAAVDQKLREINAAMTPGQRQAYNAQKQARLMEGRRFAFEDPNIHEAFNQAFPDRKRDIEAFNTLSAPSFEEWQHRDQARFSNAKRPHAEQGHFSSDSDSERSSSPERQRQHVGRHTAEVNARRANQANAAAGGRSMGGIG